MTQVLRAFAMDAEVVRAGVPPALAEQLAQAGDSLTMTLQDLMDQETPA
jgi:hypothetical protein